MRLGKTQSKTEACVTSQIALRNLSGVPVLDIAGEINRTLIKNVEATISTLIRAGHYHLVLNLTKAGFASAQHLRGLAKIVREVNKHYGGVHLVAGMEQVSQRVSSDLKGLFRFYVSEWDALTRIKGTSQAGPADQAGISARLAD